MWDARRTFGMPASVVCAMVEGGGDESDVSDPWSAPSGRAGAHPWLPCSYESCRVRRSLCSPVRSARSVRDVAGDDEEELVTHGLWELADKTGCSITLTLYLLARRQNLQRVDVGHPPRRRPRFSASSLAWSCAVARAMQAPAASTSSVTLDHQPAPPPTPTPSAASPSAAPPSPASSPAPVAAHNHAKRKRTARDKDALRYALTSGFAGGIAGALASRALPRTE